MPDLQQAGRDPLPFMYRISRAISSGRPIDATLQEVVALTVEASRCDACLLYVADHECGEIVLRAARHWRPGDIGALRCKPGEDLGSWMALHSSPTALSNGASADARFRLDRTLLDDSFEALLSVPLIGRGELAGALNVHYREAREHSPDEIALLCFVGEQVGGAVVHASLTGQNARVKQEALLARQQLEERKTVERAKGLLQQRLGLSEDQAYQRLRDESRRRRLPMREVAAAVLLVEGIATRPKNGTGGR